LLFTFFLGGIGAHKFYTGRNWQGFFYLIFCWTGIPALIALIEFIIYAFITSEKLQEKYSVSRRGVVIAFIAGGIGFIFLLGILAAIAIPGFISYRNLAYQAAVKSELQNLLVAEEAYFVEHNKYTTNLRDLNFTPVKSGVTLEIISADEKCFEAKATHSALQEPMSIDCNDLKQYSD
jgi:Tfp pilus assembly protein PilE